MSGSGGVNLPVNIGVTGTAEAEAAFNRVQTAATTSMQRVQQTTAQAGVEGSRFGNIIGQAGFQVQDFATQVQMGQNALQAFGVQFAQFAGAFGTGGAIAGAVVVAGTLAAQMIGLGSATDTLAAAVEGVGKGYDRLNDAAERRQRGLQNESEAVARLADEYRGMGLAAARAESLLVERRGAALDLEAGRMREALQGTLSDSVLRRLNPPDGSRGSEFGLGDMGLARADEQFTALADIFARVGSQAGQTQQNIRELAAEADRLAQAGGTSAQSFVRLRDAALDMLPAASQLDAAQRQIAVQTVAAAQAMGNSDEVIARYAARFGSLASEVLRAGQSLNALRQGSIGIAEDRIANEIRRNEATLAALRGGGVEAGTAAREAGAREDQILKRASDLAAEARREMEAALVPLDDIRERLREGQAEFVALATRAVDSGRAVDDGLKPVREGASRAAAAVREIADAYEELRFSAGGTGALLMGSDADVKAADAIAGRLRAAEQDRERALREQERQNQVVTDNIVRYGADRFADMFAENSRGWAGMLDTFRSTARSIFARIAAEAIIRPIIAPIVQATGLGQVGGIGTGGGIAAGGSSSGGGFSLSSLGSIRTAYDSLSNPGRLGAFFPGGGSFNTGFSGLDGALNANAFQGAFPSEAGFQAIVDGTGATTGASFGQLLGPAASIAGGAYGIYTGLNRGGVGGYTSALGGAVSAGTGLAMLGSAAGLLPALGALGPIGLAAGAVLAIAGALLPGGKPSGQGQLARTNLATDALSFEGLGGSRFSQGNRDAATNAVSGISALVKEIGDKLGGATLGGNAAVGVTNGTLYLDVNGQQAQFGNNAEGAKQLSEAAARFVLEEFRRQGTVGGDYAGILNASGTPDALAQNLQWYDQVYKKIISSTPAVSAYEKAIEGVWNQFEPAIQKARELSIATDELTRAREDEYRRVYLERERAVKAFDDDVFVRTLRAQGNVYADMVAFDAALPQQLREVRTSLEALGLSAEDVSTRISQVEYAAGLERLNIIKAAKAEENRIAQQAAEAQVQSARGVLDWLNAQSLGALSSLSPTARLAEAERQFNSAFAAGDARGVTGAADALLSASRDVFGGATTAYAEREAFVRQSVGQVGLRAAQAGGNGDVVQALGQMVAVLQAELSSLGAKFEALTAETRRGNNQALAA